METSPTRRSEVFYRTLRIRESAEQRFAETEARITQKRTFGRIIVETRKQLGLSQKQLAEQIKREDGTPISPQYLNDIEHDRRSPTGQFLIAQLAKVLKLDADYLSFLAGQFPESVRRQTPDADRFATAWQAFRRELRDGKRNDRP